MEDIYLLIGAAALFVIQIACFFIKKIWLRLMPVLVVVACIVFCVAMYILSGCTNWAYLILLALLFFLLAAQAIAWGIFGVICWIKKCRV